MKNVLLFLEFCIFSSLYGGTTVSAEEGRLRGASISAFAALDHEASSHPTDEVRGLAVPLLKVGDPVDATRNSKEEENKADVVAGRGDSAGNLARTIDPPTVEEPTEAWDNVQEERTIPDNGRNHLNGVRAAPSSSAEDNLPELYDLSKPMKLHTNRNICGTDTRQRVSATTSTPWDAVVHLTTKWSNGQRGTCSGFFTGRNVMTAAHCLYSHDRGGWADQVTVCPGRDGSSKPYDCQTVTTSRLLSVNGWVNNRAWGYDYGMIILPNRDLIDSVGYYFGFANWNDDTLDNSYVHRSGYPGDKPSTQWYSHGNINEIYSKTIIYSMDMVSGASGGPVWVKKNGSRYIVGINSFQYDSDHCRNGAVRVHSDLYDFMLNNRWRTS